MAHFAELDGNNEVLRVIVVNNKDIVDDNGEEKEEIGIAFCKSLFGEDTKWVQTSYNATMRGKYAGYGDIYDEVNDEFYTPVPDVVNVDSTVNEQQAIEGN